MSEQYDPLTDYKPIPPNRTYMIDCEVVRRTKGTPLKYTLSDEVEVESTSVYAPMEYFEEGAKLMQEKAKQQT